jgi:hypothetical protein
VLLRSLRQLRIRVQRFGVHRATSAADRAWALEMTTALDAALERALFQPGARLFNTLAYPRSVPRREPTTTRPAESRLVGVRCRVLSPDRERANG